MWFIRACSCSTCARTAGPRPPDAEPERYLIVSSGLSLVLPLRLSSVSRVWMSCMHTRLDICDGSLGRAARDARFMGALLNLTTWSLIRTSRVPGGTGGGSYLMAAFWRAWISSKVSTCCVSARGMGTAATGGSSSGIGADGATGADLRLGDASDGRMTSFIGASTLGRGICCTGKQSSHSSSSSSSSATPSRLGELGARFTGGGARSRFAHPRDGELGFGFVRDRRRSARAKDITPSSL